MDGWIVKRKERRGGREKDKDKLLDQLLGIGYLERIGNGVR
jgi:hypothetical protein